VTDSCSNRTSNLQSAGRAGSKLHEIFTEGITVYGSDRLDEIRKEVVADE